MRRSLLALTVLLLFAPAARADDAALFAVYDDQAKLDAIVDAQVDVYENSSGRAFNRGVIRTDKRMNRELSRIATALSAAETSSDDGRAAQTAAVRETKAWRTANRFEIRSNRAFLAGRRALADRLIRRANRTMKGRTYPAGKEAVRHFKAIGLSSPRRALSAGTKD